MQLSHVTQIMSASIVGSNRTCSSLDNNGDDEHDGNERDNEHIL
jgi:hypothetical protein